MPLPGREQTFAYANCRQLLDKLKRELNRYHSSVGSNRIDELRDLAFNASVTAWHLADWVFHDLTDEQRKKLGFGNLLDLQKYAWTKCRAVYLCQYAATASKHWVADKYPDPTVQTIVAAETGWTIYFVDETGRGKISAEQVFAEALNFWTEFIYGNEIALDWPEGIFLYLGNVG